METDIADPAGPTLDSRPAPWLVCRLGARLCALPLENVVETMRPLPVRHFAGAPRCVEGVAIIRGAPVPVVDTASLFGESASEARRWVVVEADRRFVALALDEVLGIRPVDALPGGDLPPLLRDALADVVSAIGTLDAELLVFLSAARIVPQAAYESSAPRGTAP